MIRTILPKRLSTLKTCSSLRLRSSISTNPLRVIAESLYTLYHPAPCGHGATTPGFDLVAGAKIRASHFAFHRRQLTRRVDPETPWLWTLQRPISLTDPVSGSAPPPDAVRLVEI